MRLRESYLVDADILYAYLNPTDWLHEEATKVVSMIKDVKLKAYITPIIVLELAVVIKRDLSEKTMLKLYEELKKIGLKTIPVDENVVKTAFDYLKRGMGIFDSFHAAVAKHNNLVIISTDHKYDEMGLKRLDPKSF